MNQSKLESTIEIFFNYLSGFLMAWATYAFIVLPTPWLRESAFWTTSLFTIISIARSYFWRRFFNARLHMIVHQIIKSFYTGINYDG